MPSHPWPLPFRFTSFALHELRSRTLTRPRGQGRRRIKWRARIWIPRTVMRRPTVSYGNSPGIVAGGSVCFWLIVSSSGFFDATFLSSSAASRGDTSFFTDFRRTVYVLCRKRPLMAKVEQRTGHIQPNTCFYDACSILWASKLYVFVSPSFISLAFGCNKRFVQVYQTWAQLSCWCFE